MATEWYGPGDVNKPVSTIDVMADLEKRTTELETKLAQFEEAYRNFVKSAEENPILRMALGKLGINSDGSIG